MRKIKLSVLGEGAEFSVFGTIDNSLSALE
jgi:hypothetical protein